jgi:hypothetical protein
MRLPFVVLFNGGRSASMRGFIILPVRAMMELNAPIINKDKTSFVLADRNLHDFA